VEVKRSEARGLTSRMKGWMPNLPALAPGPFLYYRLFIVPRGGVGSGQRAYYMSKVSNDER
jgi:hypothetical protein